MNCQATKETSAPYNAYRENLKTHSALFSGCVITSTHVQHSYILFMWGIYCIPPGNPHNYSNDLFEELENVIISFPLKRKMITYPLMAIISYVLVF